MRVSPLKSDSKRLSGVHRLTHDMFRHSHDTYLRDLTHFSHTLLNKYRTETLWTGEMSVAGNSGSNFALFGDYKKNTQGKCTECMYRCT